MKEHQSIDDPQTLAARELSKLVDADDLVHFYPPQNPTQEEAAFIADIVSLDHRSHHILMPGTREREEVKRLLYNAVVQGISNKLLPVGTQLYQKAERAYYDHLQTRNRIKYLLGMLLGCIAAVLFGAFLYFFPGILEPFVTPHLLASLFLFAGLGSIASVLTRLSSIDLRQDTSNKMTLISGATKPVVAIVFAMVVYLILDMKIIDIKFGSPTEAKADGVFLISSFLCGFSERFANDIISRVGLPGAVEPS